jgi:hypothetical protein
MATTSDLLQELRARIDRGAIDAAYQAISVESGAVRQQIDRRRLARLDPRSSHPARIEELDFTADRLIEESANAVGALGGVAGLGGLITMAPEGAGWLVSVLRLAQRLAIVYGFDPESDRGKMAILQALAAGFEVELPEAGVSGMRLSDVVKGASSGGTGKLARAAAMTTMGLVAGRFARFVPVVSSGVSAVGNAREIRVLGSRMKTLYGRIAELPARLTLIEDAVEL